MYIQRKHPKTLSKTELDHYLSKGWYRMNQMIFTSHFIFSTEGLFSPIWLRYDLSHHTFSKSLRKILNRNDQKFVTKIGQASMSYEYQDLYEVYRDHFDGTIAETLHESVMGNRSNNIYNTYAVEIYDSDSLIALSLFDIGHKSIASIIGIYHPDYAKYSLGIYTMLKEMNWSKSYGKQHYYPGYFVPRWTRFDYKLRLGAAEFYDAFRDTWKDMSEFTELHIPLVRLMQGYSELGQELDRIGLGYKLVFYPYFEEEYDLVGHPTFQFLLRSPIILIPDKFVLNLQETIAVEYHPKENQYSLLHLQALTQYPFLYTQDNADTFGADLICTSILVGISCIHKNKTASTIAEAIQSL